MRSKKYKTAILTVLLAAILSLLAVGCTVPGSSEPEDMIPETIEAEDGAVCPDDPDDAPDEEALASAPEPPPEVTATLYLPNENADGFVIEETLVAADADAQELVDCLIQRGALPEGAEVLDFQQTDTTLTVSMNHIYCDKAASMGTTGETMLLGSLVNTMLTFYSADELNITCEGNVLETGHNVYDFPLGFFENEPAEVPEVEAVLYLPTEYADGFYTESVSVELDAEPQDLIFELTARGALPEGITVMNFAQDGKTLTLDLNRQFRQEVSSMGSTGEYLRLGSLVNTMLTFYNADEIYLNVEGNPLETEHNVYDYAVGFYD